MSLPDRRYLTHKPQEQRNLSDKVNATIDLDDGTWMFQTKHDGCHAVVLVGVNIVRIFSREGKECFSMPHIAEYFRVNSAPNMVYFGEAWAPDASFPENSGMFRRGTPQPDLGFVAFDAVTLQEFRAGESSRPFFQRFKACISAMSAKDGVMIPITHQDLSKVKQAAAKCKETSLFALDGFMAKKYDGGWKAGVDREGLQLKLKDVLSVDLRCVGVEMGEGKFDGMVGNLTCEYKGQIIRVSGGKLRTKEREEIWANKGLIVGKIVEVHALGESSNGVLREPRFQYIRLDKTEPSE